jgi:pimeloyl-ACP methyl ester carboxylesterase
MMPEEVTLNTDSGIRVSCTVKKGNPLVVFSHGFGVKRDSRGMFTDITNALPKEWGYILFDHTDVDGDNVTVRPYSKQVEMLKKVVEYAHKQTDTVHIIGHSRGSITVCLASLPDVEKVILIVPPVATRPYPETRWEAYEGAHWDSNILVVPRKDGTTTRIPQSAFNEDSATQPLQTIMAYSEIKPLVVIQAEQDHVLTNTERYDNLKNTKNITFVKLPGNHDFDAPNRTGFVSKTIELLLSAV